MPVSLVVGDIASFRKYVKYIGRAYQKRSVAMIQLCRLFLEISPGKPDQMDALRSLFETVEDALKSAVDAGKERREAADTAFATAEEELDWYAQWHHPKEQSVLGDVQNIIEDAALKDSFIMKTHKRLSTRLGLNRTDSPPSNSLVKVHFQILQCPTDRREAPVVTCELGPDVKISELLWTFSRLPEDQRISLKQNPHFYFSRDLSDQVSAYDDQFKLEPLKDLRPEKDSVVLVLLDRAGQIFVDYQKFSKTYGNIWKPHNTIVLKDLQGTLEAANRICASISGEVCIWQRGGGHPGEDVSKWTEVLDRALDLPAVDWLVRSETSSDEAFDIEVTGGWERCSPVIIPDPLPLFGQDKLTVATPAHEGIHISSEQTSSLAAQPSSLTLTDGSSGQASDLSQDIPPSDVGVALSSEEAQCNIEERSHVEDRDSSSSDNVPQVEAALHPSVQPVSTSIEPFTPHVENEPVPASNVSSPDTTAPMSVETICSQDETVPAQTLLVCSSEPLTLPISNLVAPPSSSVHTYPGNLSSGCIHPPTGAVDPPPVRPACVPLESSAPPNGSELSLASTALTPDTIALAPDPVHPHVESIPTPVHAARSLSGHRHPMPPDECPASTRSRATPSGGTLPQIEVVRLTNIPLEPPAPASGVPTFDKSPPTSNTISSRSVSDCLTVTPARPFEPLISPTGSMPTPMSGMSAPHLVSPSPEHAHPRVVEVASRPLVEPSLVPPAEPIVPNRKKSTPARGPPTSQMKSPSLEPVRPQVDTARSPIQNPRVPPKNHVSSIVASNPSFSYRAPPPPQRVHARVEAARPPGRHAYSPPDSRTPHIGNKSTPSNTPDAQVHLSSRSRIRSHPRKMPTPIGERRSTVLATQLNPQPIVQPSGQSIARSTKPPTAGSAPSSSNAMPFHPPPVEPSNHGRLPGTRCGYQGHSADSASPSAQAKVAMSSASSVSNGTSRMSSITQDPISHLQRSTVSTGRKVPHLTMPSCDKPARSRDKAAFSSAPDRSSFVSVARQDRTTSHSSQAKSSSLAGIQEGQGAARGYSMVRPGTPPIASTAAASLEKVNSANSPLKPSNSAPRTSSIVDIKHSATQGPKVLPERISQLAVRSSYQPVIPSPSVAVPVAMARLGKTPEVSSYSSRTDTPGGAVAISASPTWNNTPRISARIKTKDLISRHKQQQANDVRPLSIAESARVPISGLSKAPPLASKPSVSRIDSGIEIWDDYHSHGVISDRRRGSDPLANGHIKPPRDRGSPPAPPSDSPVCNNPSLSLKKSRASIQGSLSRTSSLTSSAIPTTSPLSPSQAQTFQSGAIGSPLTGSPASSPLGRREPFIHRKPQTPSQGTSRDGSTSHSGFATPPRSSTPSSASHSASITTSSQATMITPATSFTIPSRVPSPATDAAHKSWFRRNVVDPFKSKLGYGS